MLCIACRARDECLNETLFSSLREARDVLKTWKEDYNLRRPHSALGNLTPSEFAEKMKVDRIAA
jgi:putative transposase